MISCHLHDEIELLCIKRILVTFNLVHQQKIIAVALDTVRNDKRQECVKVKSDNKEQLIILEEIESIEINEPNDTKRIIRF